MPIRHATVGFFGLLLLLLFASIVMADEQSDRRMLMGLKLFPALVAADQALMQKRMESGALQIILLYREDIIAASNAAKRLAATKFIKNLPLQITTLPYERLGEFNGKPPAALFLAEWSPDDLANVVHFGIAHQRIVFSPFKGDVSAGVMTGIFISDRMLPLINREALDRAGIRLQPFLLDVAKTHE